MRKPRDYDAELKVLTDRAKLLRDRKVLQLGEVVVATAADQMPVEQLAGALLAAIDMKDAVTTEAWRERGAAFFQRTAPRPRGGSRGDHHRARTSDGGTSSS